MAAILESKMGFSEPIQGNNFIKQQYPQYINGFPPATGVLFYRVATPSTLLVE
jgi:hypothetical protein